MAKKRREKDVADIKLKHPDRSGPSEPTLLQLAGERNLFQQALDREKELKRQKARASKNNGKVNSEVEDDSDEDEGEAGMEGLPPRMERIMDTLLWSVSLAMLHFTLDVLVQNQYAVELDWHVVIVRTGRAFPGMPTSLICYSLRFCDVESLTIASQFSCFCSTPSTDIPQIRHCFLVCPLDSKNTSARQYSSQPA